MSSFKDYSSFEAILPNTRWNQNGIIVAGGNGSGEALNQLFCPYGFCVDEDQTIVIADWKNHRIMEWKRGDTCGRVVAGGNREGKEMNQLSRPTDVIIDKETDSFIICDRGNERVIRWPRENRAKGGEILIDYICGHGLTMDHERNLYVTDEQRHDVRRYRIGETNGTVVAGGNDQGNLLDQLDFPANVFVDDEQTVYVSDSNNNRIMKWMKGAREGIIVAGGQGKGIALSQLWAPNGVFVDKLGSIYVADCANHRVMRWYKGTNEGEVIVGGNGEGIQTNQLSYPVALSFDFNGNLYVGENENHRIQKFSIVHS